LRNNCDITPPVTTMLLPLATKSLRRCGATFQSQKAAAKAQQYNLLYSRLGLVGWTVDIKPVLKRRSNYHAAAGIGQVVDKLRAVEAAGEKM